MYEDIEQTRDDDLELIRQAKANLAVLEAVMERNRLLRPDRKLVGHLAVFSYKIDEQISALLG
ncbi:MAG TPA: hypothetical protein PKY50_06220 [Candidatus Competibacter sp.]|nr:hypothetical protein [Candidatus Competibacter sp.]